MSTTIQIHTSNERNKNKKFRASIICINNEIRKVNICL